MAKISTRDLPDELTPEEKKELEALETRPITYDEDSPKMTDQMLRQFHRFDEIPVLISDSNISKVRAFGSQYRQVLNRLINLALDDKDLVNRCL